MSYIYMKILERRPARYDAGIRRLSGQDWPAIREKILQGVKPGERVLEIGCGPGTLALELARRGAQVLALDHNPEMLTYARGQAAEAGIQVEFGRLPAEELARLQGRFDWVVASLSFSELRPIVRRAVLVWLRRLLKEGGRLVVVDEVVPESAGAWWRYQLSRAWHGLLTWLRTRKTTRPLSDFQAELSEAGYRILCEETLAPGNLRLWEAQPGEQDALPEPAVLSGGWGLSDWVESFFLWLSSHLLKVPFRPGLYRIGRPGPEAPLLATSNYRLTVNLVRKHLAGRDAWLLVNDTRGVNVWCSAGEGTFSAAEIALTLAASRADRFVSHRQLILPKLCLNGVNRREVKERSGFRALIGPVYARDLPAYLDHSYEKTEVMEQVHFNFWDRMWIGVPFTLLLVLVPGVLALGLGRWIRPTLPLWFALAGMLIAVSYTWLPTRRHLVKGLILGALLAAAGGVYLFWQQAPGIRIGRSMALLLALELFVTADFSGSTPVSNRTLVEQEFKWIYIILVILIVLYFALPSLKEVWPW